MPRGTDAVFSAWAAVGLGGSGPATLAPGRSSGAGVLASAAAATGAAFVTGCQSVFPVLAERTEVWGGANAEASAGSAVENGAAGGTDIQAAAQAAALGWEASGAESTVRTAEFATSPSSFFSFFFSPAFFSPAFGCPLTPGSRRGSIRPSRSCGKGGLEAEAGVPTAAAAPVDACGGVAGSGAATGTKAVTPGDLQAGDRCGDGAFSMR